MRFDGKTDPQIVREMLGAAGRPEPDETYVQALCRRYVTLLQQELQQTANRTTLMPGVVSLIDRLEAEPSVVLGLLTGNVAEGAALKLRAAGIDPARFSVGAYGSDAAQRILTFRLSRRNVPSRCSAAGPMERISSSSAILRRTLHAGLVSCPCRRRCYRCVFRRGARSVRPACRVRRFERY